jgi:hypothetical protein
VDERGLLRDTADATQRKLAQLRDLWAELIGTRLPDLGA